MFKKILVFSVLSFGSTLAVFSINGEIQKRSTLGNTKVTIDFLYQCVIRNPGQHCSTMAHPFITSLAQLALYAEGKTYEEALRIINLRNKQEIRDLYPEITRVLYMRKDIGSPQLNMNVYTDKNNRFCPAFSYMYNRTFAGKTRVVDYSDPEETADEINDKVTSASSKFEDIISSYMIKEGAGLNFISTYQITVIYDERIRFTKTTNIQFKSGDKVRTKPCIYGQGIVKYAENKYLDSKTIELVGEGGISSYFIIYPNKRDGLLNLLKKLQTYNNFEEIISQGKDTCAKVTLLSDDFNDKLDLGQSARQSNYVKSFFKEGGLELKGATQKCDTYISSILCETQTVQATKLRSPNYNDSKCSSYPVDFVAEHPHIFFITYTKKAAEYRTPILGVVVDIGI